MNKIEDIVILESARTPVGSFLGSLKKITPTDLGVIATKGALERSKVQPEWIDTLYVGNVIQSSKDAAYLARHIGLKAKIPKTATALTVNRLCGSAMEAIAQGAKSLLLGESKFVVAGGAENMSMTPYTMRGVRDGWKMARSEVDDMLWSALTDDCAGCQIGETVEHLAGVYNISRQQADEFAVLSQERASIAQKSGRLNQEIVPVEIKGRKGKVTTVEFDEHLRSDLTLDKIANLPPLYSKEGIVTAGNSSGLNDAAAMMVLTTTKEAENKALKPLGKILSWGIAGVAPKMMGIGPTQASNQALERAGLKMDDIDVIELNDSFAVQYLAVEKDLSLDRNKVNINGGAIAIGHPMGATGARLVQSVLYTLRDQNKRYGLATLCIGGGQGMSMVIEAL